MKEADISYELATEYLSYEPETGLFHWRKKPAQCIDAGSPAGHLRPDGYLQIRFRRRTCMTHRYAYLLMTGAWPPDGYEIDHKNGDRSDNRWDNLRLVTRAQNRMNSRGNIGRDLPKGVTRNNRGKPFAAGISIDGRMTHIGSFATAEEASAAYETAARKHFGEYARAA
jgi:hypothetical protein